MKYLKPGKTLGLSFTIAAALFAMPVSQAQTSTGTVTPSTQDSGGKPSGMGGGMMNKPGMSGGQMDMKGMDMKGMMSSMNDKMASMSSTGNVDVDFAMMMRVHHQGAIDMAQAQLRDGKSAEMKKMATKIIADQKKEIARFDAYLAKNGQPVDKTKK